MIDTSYDYRHRPYQHHTKAWRYDTKQYCGYMIHKSISICRLSRVLICTRLHTKLRDIIQIMPRHFHRHASSPRASQEVYCFDISPISVLILPSARKWQKSLTPSSYEGFSIFVVVQYQYTCSSCKTFWANTIPVGMSPNFIQSSSAASIFQFFISVSMNDVKLERSLIFNTAHYFRPLASPIEACL